MRKAIAMLLKIGSVLSIKDRDALTYVAEQNESSYHSIYTWPIDPLIRKNFDTSISIRN